MAVREHRHFFMQKSRSFHNARLNHFKLLDYEKQMFGKDIKNPLISQSAEVYKSLNLNLIL